MGDSFNFDFSSGKNIEDFRQHLDNMQQSYKDLIVNLAKERLQQDLSDLHQPPTLRHRRIAKPGFAPFWKTSRTYTNRKNEKEATVIVIDSVTSVISADDNSAEVNEKGE